MKKSITRVLLTILITTSTPMISFAGEWKWDNFGWWYQNDNGSYPTNIWQWIDGNNDNIAECYYFDENGYMAASTEINGYTVDSNGAWIANGVVQRQQIVPQTENYVQSDDFNYEDERLEEAKEALCEAGMISFYEDNFTERKEALYNYLQVLGYDTSDLKCSKRRFTYEGGIIFGEDPLVSLLSANDGEILDLMGYYIYVHYTPDRDEDGGSCEKRIMIHNLEDEGDDGYATNLINAIESQIY